MAVSLDIQKEFQKLQRELSIIDNALREIRSEKVWNESERAKGTATLESLKPYPENVAAYKAVGRMFLRNPLPSLKKELGEYVEERQKDAQQCAAKEQMLEKQLNSAMHNIEEFGKANNLQLGFRSMDKKN